MKICILGWYGTETLGDRAILDGIFRICERKEKGNTYYLGSLIPFFTEHTVFFDRECYGEDSNLNIEIFCEKDVEALKKYILMSDYVIMGGGPIMDISEILIIRKAFSIAKKHNIKTGLIGCGFGPFHNEYYGSIANKILNLSDVIILRDDISRERVLRVVPDSNAVVLSDPAVISVLCYKEKHETVHRDYVAVNFRDTRFKVYGNQIIDVRNDLYNIICNLADCFPEVALIPMHTFFWGGDDRRYYAEILDGKNIKNVSVHFKPKSIYQLYECFAEAFGCVGMRYHSVVLQTILNGNNIILDYTESKTGKISGFMKELKGDYYSDRYVGIYDKHRLSEVDFARVLKENIRYEYNNKSDYLIEKYIGEMFK